jgi:rubrerythrin
MEKNVCYTFDQALKLAIKREKASLKLYNDWSSKAKDPAAKKFFKELALEELDHVHLLERALYEGKAGSLGEKEVQTMKLSDYFIDIELAEDLTLQDAMIFALRDEKQSAEFYKNMAGMCTGSPMQGLFNRLEKEELKHIQKLEVDYEKAFMEWM